DPSFSMAMNGIFSQLDRASLRFEVNPSSFPATISSSVEMSVKYFSPE
ncbi:9544_t:CDS:1, partial [Funneliformis geosporum]